MAKRRRRSRSRGSSGGGKVRRIYMSAPKRHRSRSRGSGAKADLGALLGAGVYGALRNRISSAVAPLTSRIPFGGIADEIGMLGINWAARRFIGGRVPLVKDMAKAGMLIEAASIGNALAGGALGGGQTTSTVIG